MKSPSSRRAWIEIFRLVIFLDPPPSPSSRRAWIEIESQFIILSRSRVALLAEGVDRNDFDTLVEELDASRPPRGGRG